MNTRVPEDEVSVSKTGVNSAPTPFIPGVRLDADTLSPVTMKRCSKCKEEKPATAEYFHRNAKKRDGFCHQCKSCKSEYNLEYRSENEETLRAKRVERRAEHRDELNARSRESYSKHREKRRAYRMANREKHHKQNKLYRQAHRERLLERARERRRADPVAHVAGALRNRMNDVLRRIRAGKVARTEKLLGCSFATFKEYVESKFHPGMSWANHGNGVNKWNLDHIKPCQAFDLSDPEQQKQCFHYTNLRPLWFIENMRKGAKWGGKNWRYEPKKAVA